MKVLLTPVILVLATLALGVTLVLTNAEPPSIWPAAGEVLTRQTCLFSATAAFDPNQFRLLASEFQSRSNLPGLRIGNTAGNSYFCTAPNPTPLLLAKHPNYQPLPPGVYQTYPWSIILVVPDTGIDDRSVLNLQSTNSSMPAIEPPVEVLPKY